MKRTMIMVVAALMPAFLFGCYNTGIQVGLEGFTAFFYGLVRVLPMVCVSYIVGLGIEFGFAQARGHEVNEGFLVTGLLIRCRRRSGWSRCRRLSPWSSARRSSAVRA